MFKFIYFKYIVANTNLGTSCSYKKLHPGKWLKVIFPGVVFFLQANFARATASLSKAQAKKVVRFLPNPERHWGPKLRAGRQITSKHVSLLGPDAVNGSLNHEDGEECDAKHQKTQFTPTSTWWNEFSLFICLFTDLAGLVIYKPIRTSYILTFLESETKHNGGIIMTLRSSKFKKYVENALMTQADPKKFKQFWSWKCLTDSDGMIKREGNPSRLMMKFFLWFFFWEVVMWFSWHSFLSS